jgi:hypothetical protein
MIRLDPRFVRPVHPAEGFLGKQLQKDRDKPLAALRVVLETE